MPGPCPGLRPDFLRSTVSRLRLFLSLEWRILAIIFSYSIAIGLLTLIVPLTVQELVSTFSFAVEPIMIATLATIMFAVLLGIAAFRVLQARAVEILIQRLYTRIAVAFAHALPNVREEYFLAEYANYFQEAELMPRALLAMLADFLNVVVIGSIGMTLLVLYHPFFVLYNMVLIGGFVVLLTVLGRRGVAITLEVSQHHYNLFDWIQDLAHNLPHLKAANSAPLLLQKTDELTRKYVMARKQRSDILTGRQYKGAAIWQAFGHSCLVGMAGWLVSAGQLTVGQFAAAEIVVGNLLINMDVLARRMYALYYVFTSFEELSRVFAVPREQEDGQFVAKTVEIAAGGIGILCKSLAFGYPQAPPLFEDFDLEVASGEKVAILTETSTGKTALAQVLAGLYTPTAGVIRYNGIDLRYWNRDSLQSVRGLVLDSSPMLLEGTLEENITLGRPEISYQTLRWALSFVEMEDEVDALPLGLRTPVVGRGKDLATSQILRLLLARAIVIRPSVLIFDGTLHSMHERTRDRILRRLCSREEPWTVVFVSNDPALIAHVDRKIVLAASTKGAV